MYWLTDLRSKELCGGIYWSDYQHFIDHVKASRGERLKGDDKTIFNGEFWTGEPALALGLVDGIDNVDSYIARTWGDTVDVKRVKGGGPLEELFGETLWSLPDLVTSLAPLVANYQAADIATKALK
jgi:ClpP class serine protease